MPDDAAEHLTVHFPELPVVSYLRTIAWSSHVGEVIVADPALESVARANGVRVLDRTIAELGNRCVAVFSEEAAKAVKAGRTTMAPVVAAPLRLWREGVANLERAFIWFEQLGAPGTSPIPAPTREIETTQRRLADAIRSAYSGA
jgi:hypothetical protein